MRLVQKLPQRWQKLAGEIAKFGIVGGVNTVINLAVFNALLLTVFTSGQLKANVVATVVAATTSYLMNRYWTYRDRQGESMRREYVLFFVFNLAGLMIELSVLGATKYGLGLTGIVAINAAKIGGLVLGTAFRFWAYRTLVFRTAPAAPAPAAPKAITAPHHPTIAEVLAEAVPLEEQPAPASAR